MIATTSIDDNNNNIVMSRVTTTPTTQSQTPEEESESSSTTSSEIDNSLEDSNSNFSNDSVLKSTSHSFHGNHQKCAYTSFFYANDQVLNKHVMSHSEQLELAITKGNLELCRTLVDKHLCDVNNNNYNTNTNKNISRIKYRNKRQLKALLPLCIACEYNYADIAELLLKRGARIDQIDETTGRTALHYATAHGDWELVELLVVKWGASVNIPDKNNEDEDENEYCAGGGGSYPLHLALRRQNESICDLLLRHGARADCVDKQGLSPLSLAINNLTLDDQDQNSTVLCLIERLLEAGADVNRADNKHGDTPLIKAVNRESSSPSSSFSAVKLLIERGLANVNARNEMTGRTALFAAIYQNNTECAVYLMERGAECREEEKKEEAEEVNLFIGNNSNNFSLLHYACFQGNFLIVKELLKRGCDPDSMATLTYETPIYIAVTKCYLDIVSLLVEYGANLNNNNSNNSKTLALPLPLHATIFYDESTEYTKFTHIIDKLIEGNADLLILTSSSNISNHGNSNSNTQSPIIYTCLQYNKRRFVKYLTSVGSSVNQRTALGHSSFYRAFINKDLELMHLFVMAGFKLASESWIQAYLQNPDLKIENRPVVTSERTDQEIAEMLSVDEYFVERFQQLQSKKSVGANDEKELTKKKSSIYNFVEHYHRNPMSLKEIARVQVRQSLLDVDHKMKLKVERDLCLPERLKDYLLFKEFNI